MQSKQLALKRIVQRCKNNYINILPYNINKKTEQTKIKVQKVPPRKQYSKTQIQQIIGQINSIVQLLTQNYMLGKNKQLKSRCYSLIKEFKIKMVKDIDYFDQLIERKSKKPIIKYKKDYSDMLTSHRTQVIVPLSPQISVYQDPLIPYLFQSNIHAQIFKNQISQQSQALNTIQRQVPIFNKHLIPILNNKVKTRSKFSQIDDRILLIGIIRCGSKNSKIIKSIYFPHRTYQQIKNRIKNLCAKQSSNQIRLWRLLEQEQLKDSQMKRLVKVFQQLGPRWKVISRYYDLKSPNFFEVRYKPYKTVKSSKYQQPNFNDLLSQKFMQRFRKFQQQFRLQMQPEQMYLMNVNIMQGQISDDQQQWDYECTQMQIEHEHQVTGAYKLINHQVFEYDQI